MTNHLPRVFVSGVGLLALALVMCLFAGWSVSADAGEEKKLVLDLDQLIQRAIANSPERGETLSDLAYAQSELKQIKAAYYPQIETTALVGPVNDADLPEIRNGRIYDPSPDAGFSSLGIFGRLDLTVTQPLYTFGKLSNRDRAATRGVAAAKSSVRKTENEIILKVSRLYYALILARGGVKVADEAGKFFNDLRSLVTRLLDLDSPNVSETDLYRIDAYQASASRSRAQAEKGERVAFFALKSMINLPPDTTYDVTEENLAPGKNKLEELETYIRAAMSERPEIRQLTEALEAKSSLVEAARSDRYPSFFMALEGSLAGAPGREPLYNPYIPDDFNHAYAGIVVGLRWHFDFGILSAKVDQGLAEYNKMLYLKKNAEMNIPIQVASAYQEVREWKTSVNAYKAASIASRKWIVSALADFHMGVGNADDILKAIEKYGSNQGNYLEALFNYHLSLTELRYASGMMKN